MSRRSGFTCPDCGSHLFGATFPAGCDDGLAGAIGHCHGEGEDRPRTCSFTWRRDGDQEGAVMYDQTLEEWMTDYRPAASRGER